MRLIIFPLTVYTFCITSGLSAQTVDDSTKIRKAALNYIVGWFEGNVNQMNKAIHPELVKRIVITDDITGKDWIDGMGASKLIERTRRKLGTKIPLEKQNTDITILDIVGKGATVKIDAGLWIDYLHLIYFNNEWKILNALWIMK